MSARAAEHSWGCLPEQLVGVDLYQRVHPDDVAEAARLLAAVRTHPGTTTSGSLRLLHDGDGWRDFEVIATNLLADPAVAGIVLTFARHHRAQGLRAELAAWPSTTP